VTQAQKWEQTMFCSESEITFKSSRLKEQVDKMS
jgi:hypothetical protein